MRERKARLAIVSIVVVRLSIVLTVSNSIMLQLLGILWASPNTLLGLMLGGIGLCFGGKVQRRGKAIEFYDGGVKWIVQRMPRGQFVLAFTLGHCVLGQSADSLDRSRAHEAVHIAQFERWGPFFLPAYFLSSVYMWCTGRRFYRDNHFEQEAYGDHKSEGK